MMHRMENVQFVNAQQANKFYHRGSWCFLILFYFNKIVCVCWFELQYVR